MKNLIALLIMICCNQVIAVNKCVDKTGNLSYQDSPCPRDQKTLIGYKGSSSAIKKLDLPKPLKGFSWVEADEIKGAFLKPDGWFFKKNKIKRTQSYFISKEDIDVLGRFSTGMSIHIVKNIPAVSGKNPTEFARNFINELSMSKRVFKDPWNRRMGQLNSFGIVVHNSDEKRGDFISYHLVIGNDQTGTAYFAIFESPLREWPTAWKTGEIILGKLYIDTDI